MKFVFAFLGRLRSIRCIVVFVELIRIRVKIYLVSVDLRDIRSRGFYFLGELYSLFYRSKYHCYIYCRFFLLFGRKIPVFERALHRFNVCSAFIIFYFFHIIFVLHKRGIKK